MDVPSKAYRSATKTWLLGQGRYGESSGDGVADLDGRKTKLTAREK
jgi:hypothetical protein